MPGFDQTGPTGGGPLTGGGRGGCAPTSGGVRRPGFVQRFLNGRGVRRSGAGRPRWGLRRGFFGRRGRGGRGQRR